MPDNHSLILPGRKRDVTPDDVDLSAFLRVKILHEQDIGTSVRGVPVETFTRDGAQDDEVIEIAYEGGLKQWLSVGQLREDLARQKPGSVSADRVTIPADLGRPPVSHGLPDLMMKGMKFFVLNPSGAAADLAVARVVSRFEDQLVPSPGLYRLTDPQTVKDIVRRDTALDTSGTLEPHLLAIFKKSRKKRRLMTLCCSRSWQIRYSTSNSRWSVSCAWRARREGPCLRPSAWISTCRSCRISSA